MINVQDKLGNDIMVQDVGNIIPGMINFKMLQNLNETIVKADLLRYEVILYKTSNIFNLIHR